MEAVLTVVFRISNPQYSFVHVGSEHGRQSVARLQILRLPRGNQEDYAFGDFEYIVRTIVEIRFQKFHCFSVQVQVQWKNRIQTSGLPFARRVKIDTRDDMCDLQSAEWNRCHSFSDMGGIFFYASTSIDFIASLYSSSE